MYNNPYIFRSIVKDSTFPDISTNFENYFLFEGDNIILYVDVKF